MSNTISWGKIYETTYWGNGVTDNTISWGKDYLDEAGFSQLTQRFKSRVEADGGVVESDSRISNLGLDDYNWTYYFRVIDDSGSVESLECVIL